MLINLESGGSGCKLEGWFGYRKQECSSDCTINSYTNQKLAAAGDNHTRLADLWSERGFKVDKYI